MIFIYPMFEILTPINEIEVYKLLERCGRTAYKSEDRITNSSCLNFIKTIMTKKHESVLEHFSITVRLVTTRDVTHELVRHRLAAYTQESQRYCNYSKDKFDGQLTFILPEWLVSANSRVLDRFKQQLLFIENFYIQSIKNDEVSQEEIRSILPNCTKTEIIITANLREWRHIFKMRCAHDVYPETLRIMKPMYETFKEKLPLIFEDLDEKSN